MSSRSIHSNFAEPRRKHGVCLTSNPVLEDRINPSCISADGRTNTNLSNEPCNQFNILSPSLQQVDAISGQLQLPAGSRQQCDFITFKGLARNQEQRLGDEVEMSHSAGGHFQAVSSLVKETIKPVREASNEQTAANDRQSDAFNSSQAYMDRDEFHTIPLDNDNHTVSVGGKNLTHPTLTKSNSNRFFADIGQFDLYENDPSITRGNSELADEKRPPFKFAGIVGTILTSLCFSLSVLFVKLLPDSDTIQEKVKAVWFRGAILMILCACSIIFNKSTFLIKRDEIWINLIRSVVGCFGTLGGYAALQYITIGESTALVYSSPIWTCLFSYLLLKEPLPIALLLALPIGLLGIILIAQPDLILGPELVELEVLAKVQSHQHLQSEPISEANLAMNTTYKYLINQTDSIENDFGFVSANSSYYNELQPHYLDEGLVATETYLEQRWPGIVMALGCSLILTIICIVLKFRKSTSIQTTTFYLGVMTVIVATVIQSLIGFGRWPTTLVECSLLFGVGFFSWVGQGLFQWSLAHEKASICGTVRTIDVVMSFGWSALFLEEDILWTSILGAALIAFIVILLMLNEYIEKYICYKCRK